MDNYGKWQYKVENELYLTEEKLTQLGAEGWELVAIHGDKAYFKRSVGINIGVDVGSIEGSKSAFMSGCFNPVTGKPEWSLID